MRRRPTRAERVLLKWIQKESQKAHYRPSVQHISEPYIIDLFFPAGSLGVEVDGLGHNIARGIEKDKRRTGILANRGITILRFTNTQVLGNPRACVQMIFTAIDSQINLEKLSAASPPPSPQGEPQQRHLGNQVKGMCARG